MVYTAASPSLAVLEVLVHLDLPSELLPDDYQLLTIYVPDDAPVNRAGDPILEDDICRETGDAFLVDATALALTVPSVVLPQERNVLLNPRHTEMGRVIVERSEPFRIDPRLVG
jgi:RES domain-containing protein